MRDDIDNEDVEESYYRYMEENPMAGVILDDDNQPLEYDEDGNVIIPDKNRVSFVSGSIGAEVLPFFHVLYLHLSFLFIYLFNFLYNYLYLFILSLLCY